MVPLTGILMAKPSVGKLAKATLIVLPTVQLAPMSSVMKISISALTLIVPTKINYPEMIIVTAEKNQLVASPAVGQLAYVVMALNVLISMGRNVWKILM